MKESNNFFTNNSNTMRFGYFCKKVGGVFLLYCHIFVRRRRPSEHKTISQIVQTLKSEFCCCLFTTCQGLASWPWVGALRVQGHRNKNGRGQHFLCCRLSCLRSPLHPAPDTGTMVFPNLSLLVILFCLLHVRFVFSNYGRGAGFGSDDSKKSWDFPLYACSLDRDLLPSTCFPQTFHVTRC